MDLRTLCSLARAANDRVCTYLTRVLAYFRPTANLWRYVRWMHPGACGVGSFGDVLRAVDRFSGDMVAIKKFKLKNKAAPGDVKTLKLRWKRRKMQDAERLCPRQAIRIEG